MRHFLDLSQCDAPTLRQILDASADRKAARRGAPMAKADADAPLTGRMLAMIFEKPSTRTRVSFDMAMRQLGGQTMFLAASDMQTDRGETVGDTARVLSRYVDAIMYRTFGEERLNELVSHASVPVINGLTDRSHPCQVMADILTFEERLGPVAGQVIAWCGDSSNVTTSWIHAAVRFGFELRIASPEPLQPGKPLVEWAAANGGAVTVTEDPVAAVKGARCVVTDTWFSMNESRQGDKHNLLMPYQVNAALMKSAGPDAIFMHCLPAHRGEEVTAEVIDGPRSVVFEEAENRLHAQKGILAWCLGASV
jgi:ornithine carbamoyltransferase